MTAWGRSLPFGYRLYKGMLSVAVGTESGSQIPSKSSTPNPLASGNAAPPASMTPGYPGHA